MAGELDPILDVVFTPASELEDLIETLAGEDGEEVDYQLEQHLETLTDALGDGAAAVEKALAKRGKSMKDLAEALREGVAGGGRSPLRRRTEGARGRGARRAERRIRRDARGHREAPEEQAFRAPHVGGTRRPRLCLG
jgi:hypothetical protein